MIFNAPILHVLFVDFDSVIDRLMMLTNINVHAIELHRQTWAEQIKTAMTVNGGDLNNATTFTYVLHFFSFFWKVLFSFIPPSAIFSGWLRFFTSLILIGIMATIISDLATIFGCLIHLDDTVTGNFTFYQLCFWCDIFSLQAEQCGRGKLGNIM